MNQSFGAYLRRERELRDISLDDISRYTRIRMDFLVAIENDNLAALPHMTFVRGYIRSYADFCGLDYKDVILRFDGFLEETETGQAQSVSMENQTSSPRTLVLFSIFMTLVILFFFYGYYRSYEKKLVQEYETTLAGINEQTVIPARPVLHEPTIEQPPAQIPQEIQPPEQAAPQVPRTAQQIILRATGLCWLQVKVDQQQPREYTLRPGDILELEAENHMRLFLGNAGGVEIEYNSEVLGQAGAAGEVKRLTFPPEPQPGIEQPQP